MEQVQGKWDLARHPRRGKDTWAGGEGSVWVVGSGLGTSNPCNVPRQEGSDPKILSIKSLLPQPFPPVRAGLV